MSKLQTKHLVLTSFLFFMLACSYFYIPKAYAQNQCPASIAAVKKDAAYIHAENNEYMSVSQGLLCDYAHKNGNLSREIPFIVANKILIAEGITKVYYESGKLKSEAPYKDNKIEGVVKCYYESGKLMSEIPYTANKKEGIEKVYRENGKMFATVTYASGSAISGLCHNTNGTTTSWTNAELTNWVNGLEVECK